jgi:hypothetical protein
MLTAFLARKDPEMTQVLRPEIDALAARPLAQDIPQVASLAAICLRFSGESASVNSWPRGSEASRPAPSAGRTGH